uniref:ATP synthase F0 subunit 8 n=1 Tax=Cystoclonium purpureum f. stellatum TaxID=3024809 RepID=UPI0023F4C2F2|nr:ATP synthase F0 subunit 8 [Cystoclonium purpureum f. stellatum]WDY85192.1 ATP synthase F0 subunit 8 [Cystoclonium purpureum f. stellatum]
MPQLDRIIIFPQIFWLFVIFTFLYAILTHYFLPVFLKSLKSRKKIIDINSTEILLLNNKTLNNNKLLKQQLLKNLLTLEAFLNSNFGSLDFLHLNNKIIDIDEKIGTTLINSIFYCDNMLLNSIVFYPKFMNLKS